MSVPEYIELNKKAHKPDLKYNIGDTVFLKTDTDRKWPMTITNFEFEDDLCNDYYCKWLNSQGKQEQGAFPEESLIKDNL